MKPEQLQRLAEKQASIFAEKNSVVVREGDAGDSCYLIQSGQVEVVHLEGGREKKIALLGPGALFGEACLLMKSPRNATVRALERTKLLEIKQNNFLEALGESAQLRHEVFELLTLRDRPKQAKGIEERPIKMDDGLQVTILIDPSRGAYYRLMEEGLFIWRLLDGRLYLKELTLLYLKKFGKFAPHAIAETISGLVASGFAKSRTTRARFLMAPTGWKKFVSQCLRFLEWRWILRNVDGKITRLYRQWIRHLFGRTSQVLLFGVSGGGLIAFMASFRSLSLKDRLREASLMTWIFVTIALVLSIVLHEAGHAFVTKSFGRKVLGVGVGWHWISPIFFVDTSDMWLATRRERILVHLAGPYANIILAGASALTAIFVSSPSVSAGLWLLSFCSYVVVLVQMLPVLHYDGHYALMEILNKKG